MASLVCWSVVLTLSCSVFIHCLYIAALGFSIPFLSSILSTDKTPSWGTRGSLYVHLDWNYGRPIQLRVATDTSHFAHS